METKRMTAGEVIKILKTYPKEVPLCFVKNVHGPFYEFMGIKKSYIEKCQKGVVVFIELEDEKYLSIDVD